MSSYVYAFMGAFQYPYLESQPVLYYLDIVFVVIFIIDMLV